MTFLPLSFAEGIRFSCQGSGNCCMSRGTYGYVYLDLPDRKRLAKLLGLKTRVFSRKYCEKSEGWYHLKNPDQDCMFLKDRRCSVYEGRPSQCRTWPFWPDNMNAKTWTEEVAKTCPGVGKGPAYSLDQILEVLEGRTDVSGVSFDVP